MQPYVTDQVHCCLQRQHCTDCPTILRTPQGLSPIHLLPGSGAETESTLVFGKILRSLHLTGAKVAPLSLACYACTWFWLAPALADGAAGRELCYCHHSSI